MQSWAYSHRTLPEITNIKSHSHKRMGFFVCCAMPLFINFITACTQMNKFTFDAYQLTLGQTKLFEQYDKFIEGHGLPPSVMVAKTTHRIKTKEDITKAIKSAKGTAVISLKYKGLDMWYLDGRLVPFTIDVRKITAKLVYKGSITLDTGFSIPHFSMLFPASAASPLPDELSFFAIVTKEGGQGYKHFTLERRSIDDSSARLPVQLTFYNGKLIYICFMYAGQSGQLID